MDTHRYFHICNHEFKKDSLSGKEQTLIIEPSKQSFIHVLIQNATVLKIKEVRAITYNVTEEGLPLIFDHDPDLHEYDSQTERYYDISEADVDYDDFFEEGNEYSSPLPKSFFEPTLHNRIKWNVTPPTRYAVLAEIRFNHTETERFSLSNCPQCSGKGWYVDVLDSNNRFQKSSGVERIAQRFLKDFFTKKRTNIINQSYGTTILEDLQINSSEDDNFIFNLIRSAVSDVEEQYLTNQQDWIRHLKNNEILVSLIVEDISRNKRNQTKLTVKLRILTQESEQLFQFGLV